VRDAGNGRANVDWRRRRPYATIPAEIADA
jgi:hypothetical protein